MESKINLHQIEKKSLSGIYQTGLVEIEIGLILIVGALAMWLDSISYYLMTLYIVPFVFIILTTKYIYEPRMGYVKFRPKRVRSRATMIIVVTAFLVVMVTMTYLGKGPGISQLINPRWIITGIILGICVAIAFFLSFDRMYFYAFLIAGAFNLSEMIRENPGFISDGAFAYLLAAIVITIVGCIFLYKFLKKYPVPEVE